MKTKTQKHTPGPWSVESCQWDQGESIVVVSRRDGVLAKIEAVERDEANKDAYMVHNGLHEPWDEANARLIAAAPDLREAVSACLKMFMENGTDAMASASSSTTAAFDMCLSAIAKAEAK